METITPKSKMDPIADLGTIKTELGWMMEVETEMEQDLDPKETDLRARKRARLFLQSPSLNELSGQGS